MSSIQLIVKTKHRQLETWPCWAMKLLKFHSLEPMASLNPHLAIVQKLKLYKAQGVFRAVAVERYRFTQKTAFSELVAYWMSFITKRSPIIVWVTVVLRRIV